jgi:Leucine-rich repeat (LRR) protein
LELIPDLQTCKNVVDLKLDGNNLTSVGRLPDQLEHLSVRNNKIAFVGGLECPTLKTLDYTNNRLISLEGISRCPELTELYVGHNYVGDD